MSSWFQRAKLVGPSSMFLSGLNSSTAVQMQLGGLD